MELELFINSTFEILKAVPTTLSLVTLSLSIGFIMAIFIVAMSLSKLMLVRFFANSYIYYFRGTPLLIQIYLMYFGFGYWLSMQENIKQSIFWDIISEPYWYAVSALMFNTAGYTAEILRGAILSIPKGQFESSYSLGLSYYQSMVKIILPQAIRQALPAYSNEVILMVKGSSLASIITIMEITGTMNKIRSETYAVYELIFIAGSIYLLINFVITRMFNYLENKYKIVSN
ncbi:MAG: ABC transporter permease [Alphaproteobacteria bacterium]